MTNLFLADFADIAEFFPADPAFGWSRNFADQLSEIYVTAKRLSAKWNNCRLVVYSAESAKSAREKKSSLVGAKRLTDYSKMKSDEAICQHRQNLPKREKKIKRKVYINLLLILHVI